MIDDLQKKVGLMSSQILAMSQSRGNDDMDVEEVVYKQQRVMDVLADCEEDARAAATVLQETVAKVEAIAECNAEMIITLTEGVQVEADAARLNVSTIAEEIRKASHVAVDTADVLASSYREQDDSPSIQLPVEEIPTTDLNDPHTVVRPKVYVENAPENYAGVTLHPAESHDVGTSQELTLSPGRSQDVVTSQDCGITPTFTISRSFQMLSEDVRAFDDSPNASSWSSRQRAATSRTSKSSIYDNYRELKRQSRKPKSKTQRNTVESSYVTLEQSYPYPWSRQKSRTVGKHVLNRPAPVARPTGLNIVRTKETVPGSTAASRTVLVVGGEPLSVEKPASVTTEDEPSEPLSERCTSATMHVVVPGQIATSRIIQKQPVGFQSEIRAISGRIPRFSSVPSEFSAVQASGVAGTSMSSLGGTPIRSIAGGSSLVTMSLSNQSSTPVSMPPLRPMSARDITYSQVVEGGHPQDMSMLPRPQDLSILPRPQEVSVSPQPPTVSVQQIHEARTIRSNPSRNSWIRPTESAVGEFISAFSSGASLSPFNNENSPTFVDTESGAFTAVQQGIMAPVNNTRMTLPPPMSLPMQQSMGLPMHQSMGMPMPQSMGLPMQQSMGLPMQQSMGLPMQQSMSMPMPQSMGLPLLPPTTGIPLETLSEKTTESSRTTITSHLEPAGTLSNGFLWNSNPWQTVGSAQPNVEAFSSGVSSDVTAWASSFNNSVPALTVADTNQVEARPTTSQLDTPPVVSAKQIATQSRRQHYGTSGVCVGSTSAAPQALGPSVTTVVPSVSVDSNRAVSFTSPVSPLTTNQSYGASSPNSVTANANPFWPPLNASAFGKDNVNLPPLAYSGGIGSLSLSSASGLTTPPTRCLSTEVPTDPPTPQSEMVTTPIVASPPITTMLSQSPLAPEQETVDAQLPASIGSLQSYEKSTPLHEPTSAIWTAVTTSLPVTAPLHSPLPCVAAGPTPLPKALDIPCLTADSTPEQECPRT